MNTTNAEAPAHWPPDVKSWVTEKVPDVGKDWRQKEKGRAEDEKIRHESEHTRGDSEG